VKNYPSSKIVSLFLLCLLCMGVGLARGHRRPHVEIVGSVHLKEPFTVRIVAGDNPIAFCQRLNVSIPTPHGLEDAPRLVDVEKLDEDKNKWFRYTGSLPDVGVAFSPVTLLSLESRDSRIQIGSAGDYRFKLRYLEGNLRPSCPKLGKRQKEAVSQVIHVQAD
jgi:hypothetical protein